MNTSKVKSVQGNGTYDSQYGTLYKFEYHLEDGATFTANHKTDSPLPVGTEVDYEIKGTNEYGSYGKISKHKEDFKRGGGDLIGIKIGHAISNAVPLAIKAKESNPTIGSIEELIKSYAKMIYRISEELNKELGVGTARPNTASSLADFEKPKVEASIAAQATKSRPAPAPPVEAYSDDLPF